MRLLLVEDDPQLLQQLDKSLRDAGYAVDRTDSGEEAVFLGGEYAYDVAIVDLGLPDISGMEVIRRLRARGRAFPVLILTAQSRWQEKVTALESGADDYVVKPFQFEEIMARLNALIRRSSGFTRAVLQFGDLQIDTLGHKVSLAGENVELTSFEYQTLEYLALNPGKVVSRSELIEHLYNQDFERDSNVIEVFIGRLRRKIDPQNATRPIETVRGQGYRFALEADDP